MKRKIFGSVLLTAFAIIAMMGLWSSAASLISMPNTMAVLSGFGLMACLIGFLAISVYMLLGAIKKKVSSDVARVLAVFIVLPILMLNTEGCTRVDPGYVGIKVNMYGSDKGVEDLPLVTGRVWFNPISEDVYIFPTFMQMVTWTQSKTEESPNDDSITFNSSEGAIMNSDISIAYKFAPEMVPSIFKEFRQDAKTITWKYLRSQVRDAFNRHASTLKAADIFGAKKQELLSKVKEDLNARLKPKGFEFDLISFVGALRADANVLKSINAVIEAAQKAIEAQNKIVQATAEADQKIQKARGDGESVLIIAKKQAEANRIVAESITPALIQWESLTKWNGVLPTVTGGAVPFVSLPQAK